MAKGKQVKGYRSRSATTPLAEASLHRLIGEAEDCLERAEQAEADNQLDGEMNLTPERRRRIQRLLDEDFLQGLSGEFSLYDHINVRPTGTAGNDDV